MTAEEIDLYNHSYILDFLNSTPVAQQCDISGSVKATVCQFLMNFKIEINRLAKPSQEGLYKQVSPIEIMDAQIKELRQCVVDLEQYKDRLTKGVIHQ